MSDEPYTDDEYDSTYKDVHGDDPVRDQYVDDSSDDAFFPSTDPRTSPAGVPGEQGVPGDKSAPSAEMADAESDEDSWMEEGLVTMLLVVGVALFIFPEPATSAIGIGLVALGLVLWAADRMG